MTKEHVLIVGGTKGAGRAAVRLYQPAGHKVSVIARRPPATSDHANVRYWAADILDAEAIRRSLKEIWQEAGDLSTLLFFQRFRGEGDDWTGEIETSLTATKRIIELLVNDHNWRDGSIVIVSSINANFISKHLPLSYHMGKAGLNQMVRYYAVALGPRGIRINSVSPGTFLKEESREFFLKNKELHNLYLKMIPLGRMCTAEEVVQVVEFLGSRKAGFVTGQDIIVDGGLTLMFQEALVREITGA